MSKVSVSRIYVFTYFWLVGNKTSHNTSAICSDNTSLELNDILPNLMNFNKSYIDKCLLLLYIKFQHDLVVYYDSSDV